MDNTTNANSIEVDKALEGEPKKHPSKGADPSKCVKEVHETGILPEH